MIKSGEEKRRSFNQEAKECEERGGVKIKGSGVGEERREDEK